jgi:hypothetical protein
VYNTHYIYNQLNHLFSQRKNVTVDAGVEGITLGILLNTQGTYCTKPSEGDHLDRVHSVQKVLKMIRRGGWSLLSESQTSSRDHQTQVLRSDGSHDARWEAVLCEQRTNSRATFFDDAQMRVRKQLLAAKKPNRKKAVTA